MTTSCLANDLMTQVNVELRSIVTSRDMPLYQMMSYHLGWNEKQNSDETVARKQRPHGVLCLLACRAAGGETTMALPAATAIELANNFCQIHDDVQEGKPQRDGRDTVWWTWGPAQAINVGDGMHALARISLFRLSQEGISSDKSIRAIKLLDEASLQACEGRFADLEYQDRTNIGLESYLKTVASKTGALLACAMKLGGLVATDKESVLEALGTCGSKLGVAMKIQMDLRELWGSTNEDSTHSPKPELMNIRKLIPVIYALEKASKKDRRILGDIYFKRVLNSTDVVKLQRVMDELGARTGCEELAHQYRTEATNMLDIAEIPTEFKDEIAIYAASLTA